MTNRNSNRSNQRNDWNEMNSRDNRGNNAPGNLDDDQRWQDSDLGQGYQNEYNERNYGGNRQGANYNGSQNNNGAAGQRQRDDHYSANENFEGQGSAYGGGRGNHGRNYNGGTQYNSGYGGQEYTGQGYGAPSQGMAARGNNDQAGYNKHEGRGTNNSYGNNYDQQFGNGGAYDHWNRGNSYGTGAFDNSNYAGRNFGAAGNYGSMVNNYSSTGANQGYTSNYGSGAYDQENNQGAHRGKGPKGYRRSDERVKEEVNDRLSDDAHIDASDVEVDVKNGEVILTGTVDSRETKRRAEYIVEAVSGVSNVENRLRVSSSAGTGTRAGGNGDASVNTGGDRFGNTSSAT